MDQGDSPSSPSRLPQDVAVDASVRVTLATLRAHVDEYAELYERALDSGTFVDRVTACWGLVARGKESSSWTNRQLGSGDELRISDAVGVMIWTGMPGGAHKRLETLARSLPDGEARDAIFMAIDRLIGAEPGDDDVARNVHLFDGEFRPFTDHIDFVEAPMRDVLDEFARWAQGAQPTPLSLSLRDSLPYLDPVVWMGWKDLVVETDSAWTAIFSQGGSRPLIARGFADRLGCRSVAAVATPHVVRDKRIFNYGSRSFELFEGSTLRRVVHASYQSRWEWHTLGEPLPFESSTLPKRIPDRLTPELVNTYCAALGIRIAEPSFYLPNSMLFELDRPWIDKTLGVSRQEYQAQRLTR